VVYADQQCHPRRSERDRAGGGAHHGRYAAGEARTGGAPQQQIIQPLAQAITRRNDLLYAIVTDMQGIRYSHPDSSIIGKPFIGHDIQPTLQGKENVAINHGVLAPALRVFTPVFNDQHQQIGVVVVGISLSKVDEQIANSRWDVLLTILFSALVCALGTWSLVRGLKRVLLGLEPHEISTQFQQRQAMLHALKEGWWPSMPMARLI
jgi:two-component system sensor histidine kinase DcuS